LSLAIGRRGQNVRLASKLVGWDIEIMTHDELNEGIEKAENWFRQIPNTTDEMVEAFIEEGFLSYDDLTFLEPAQLAELSGTTEEQAQEMIDYAEEAALRVEEESRVARAAEAEAQARAEAEAAAAGPAVAEPTNPMDKLFPAEEAGSTEEKKPTMESLFGPETEAAADQAVESTEPPAENTPESPASNGQQPHPQE
jgi:N utilization substance protein A